MYIVNKKYNNTTKKYNNTTKKYNNTTKKYNNTTNRIITPLKSTTPLLNELYFAVFPQCTTSGLRASTASIISMNMDDTFAIPALKCVNTKLQVFHWK